MGGVIEGRIGRLLVAAEMHEADIVGAIVPHQGGAGRAGGGGVGDRRQRIIVHLDPFGGVLGLVPGPGDDEGDGVADPPHPVMDQGVDGGDVGIGAVAALAPLGVGQVAETRRLPIGMGQDRQHARRRLGGGGVEGANLGMGMGRTNHHAVGHARQLHVVDEPPPALEETLVLGPPYRLPQRVFTHVFPP